MNATAKTIEMAPATTGNVLPVEMTPMGMLDRAVAQGANIETLTKLMDLQERWEKNHARRAFEEALAAAKAEIEIVEKNATGHNNKRYANFAAYAKAVDPALSKHGITYRFRTRQDEKTISVTCILSKGIHSEENTLAGPADASGSKNAIQAIGSTLTYLQRYSLVQALGLAASEDDDGKAAGAGQSVTDDQVETLRKTIMEANADLPKFLESFSIERLNELPVLRFSEALAILNMKITADKKKAGKAPAKEEASTTTACGGTIPAFTWP